MDSFFLLVVFIIGLVGNINTEFGTIGAAYLHHVKVQLIFDFYQLALSTNFRFGNKQVFTVCPTFGELQDEQRRLLRLKLSLSAGLMTLKQTTD
ncbi:MAG: hypothetical protein HRU34_17960 [Richelia sp.]|nr:hypothetical protein [Richelia sp.]